MKVTSQMISAQIAKGQFRPHTALTNMALSYFQNAENYFAKAIFPICRVPLSADQYFIFNKEDLLRDNWQRKPEYGKVMPAVVSEQTGTYVCKVDQNIMGISDIRETDLTRRQGPSIATDPRMMHAKTMAEQANIHQDRLFANAFFKTGVWTNEWTGVNSTTPNTSQFIKFSNANSDPVKFIDDRKMEMHQNTGRTPNKLALGANVFTALKNHPGILDRVKYGGTTANPANVTKRVLAELFGVDEVVVMLSIQNKGKIGANDDMDFIGDPDAFLLAYATAAPSLNEPSAGYIFTWDMLGDGQIMPIMNYPGEAGTHTEYVEGLMAYDMKKTADDLGMFFGSAV